MKIVESRIFLPKRIAIDIAEEPLDYWWRHKEYTLGLNKYLTKENILSQRYAKTELFNGKIVLGYDIGSRVYTSCYDILNGTNVERKYDSIYIIRYSLGDNICTVCYRTNYFPAPLGSPSVHFEVLNVVHLEEVED